MKSLFGAAYGKLSGLYTGVQSYFKPQQKPIQNKLLKQIQACCYEKQKVPLIHEAVEKVMSEYPGFQSGLLIFQQDMIEKSVIQLQGDLSIEYKTRNYPVRARVYIPQDYPKNSSMIRIINTDPDNYRVNPVYQQSMSSNDQNSYMLVGLDTFQNWNPEYLDICSMMAEAREVLGKNFPWKKVGQGSKITKQTKKQQEKVIVEEPQKDKIPQQQFHISQSLSTYQSFCKQSFKRLPSTIPLPTAPSLLQPIQTLQLTSLLLSHQLPLLKSKTLYLQHLISQRQSQYQHIPLNEIVYANGKDDMLLELVCENKACEEELEMVERMYERKKVNLEGLVRNVRRIQQGRFMVRWGIRYMMEAELN